MGNTCNGGSAAAIISRSSSSRHPNTPTPSGVSFEPSQSYTNGDDSQNAGRNREAPIASSHTPPNRPPLLLPADPGFELPPNRPPLLLPADPGFELSANGSNGWRFSDIYDVGRELGRGAFGAVYVGVHKFAQQEDEDGDSFTVEWKNVAIKRTRPNSLDLRDANGEINDYRGLERHCQEVKTLLRLKEGSPTMSPVLFLYEIFMAGRDFYMVTEQLDQELDEWRSQVEVFTEKMAIDICKTVLSAVDYMHSRDVVHRDLKLQNMMFSRRGDFRSLKIVDFGLARVLEPTETARDFCGSIGYSAPVRFSKLLSMVRTAWSML